MNTPTLSRRSFSKLIGVSAAFTALQPLKTLKAAAVSDSAIVRLSSNENP